LQRSSILLTTLLIFISNLATAQLAGGYTIDATQAASATNYQTFSSAISDLISGTRADGGTPNGNGVSASVNFQVANGTYTEQLEITSITGTSNSNNIVFESVSGDSSLVKIEFSPAFASNYVVNLNGTSFITFKKLTIENTKATNCTVIEIEGNTSDINISNCHILGQPSTSSSSNYSIIKSTGDANHNISITNNHIENGSKGIEFIGGSSTDEINLVISNNLIESYYYRGIVAYNQESPLIEKNTLIGTSSATLCKAIDIRYVSGGMVIDANRISGNHNIILELEDIASTTSNHTVLKNNFFQSDTEISYGIAFENGNNSYIDLIHNSIYVENTSSNKYAVRIENGTNNITFLNNIIFIEDGYTIYNQSGTSITASDNNNLHTNGGGFSYSGTTHNTLAAWQTGTSFDANSISADPLFTSSTDLHLTNGSPCIAAGVSSTVTVDIDGNTRNATPDIGAHEYQLSTGISNVNKFSKTTLYPNPAANQVKILLGDNKTNTILNIVIIDVFGRIVLSEQTNNNALDITALENGNYFVQLHFINGDVEVQKLMIMK